MPRFQPARRCACALLALACFLLWGSGVRAYESPAFDRGMREMRRGDYDGAIISFGEAIGFDQTNLQAYLNRGRCFYQMGNLKDSITDFTYVIDRDPKISEAWLWRGTAHSRLGEHELAIGDYLKAVAADPQLAARYNNSKEEGSLPDESKGRGGNKLYGHVKNPGAVSDYEEAMRQYNQRQNQSRKAEGDSAPAISPDPRRNRGGSKNNLANNIDNMDPKEAIGKLNAALDQEPNNDAYYFRRGLQYKKLGDMSQAITDISKAIELNPMEAKYYLARARIYRKQNQPVLSNADVKAAHNVDARLPKRINLDTGD